MTVSTELSHEEYVGNGVTTDFDFRFRIFESRHLIVVVADSEGNETTLKNGTDYTIVGAGSFHGGKVVLNKPLAKGWKILLERDLPVVQETDLRNQGKFFAEVHEDAFDYLTMLIQKALGTFSLSLRKPTYLSNYYDAKGNRIANLAPPKLGTDSANKDYVDNSIKDIDSKTLRVKDKAIPALPSAEQRRNKQLGFDNEGYPQLLDPAETGSLGYVLVDSFEKGTEITTRYQALHWESNGGYYRWDGELPKYVPLNSNPENTGGVGVGKWLSIGDASLRQELKKEVKTEKIITNKITINDNELIVGENKITVLDDHLTIGNIKIGRRVGDIYYSAFPSTDLDFGEFEANGAPHSIDSQVGTVLKNLSFAYRMAWGIVETNGYINLPNMYDRDGFGLYMRAGQVGDGHQDAIETITGQFSIRAFGTTGVAPVIHDRKGAISAESSNFTGVQVSPITSTASEKQSSQMIWFQSNNSSKGGAETRVRTRTMTPVVFLGVDNNHLNKDLIINTSSNIPIYTIVHNAGFQSSNLTQSSLIKYGSVYTLHPYYEDLIEKGVVIGNHLINDDKVTLITKTDKMRHQGLGVIGFNGERYYISSANDVSNEINKSTHIACFKESNPDDVVFYKVFEFVGSGMVSPSISEDGEYIVVMQYDSLERYITVKILSLYELLFKNKLIEVSNFSIHHPYIKGGDVFQCMATDKKHIYMLFGGLTVVDDITLRKYSFSGELLNEYFILAGKNEAKDNHNGFIEPETIFFLNGDLYYMPILGPTGKRFNPIYKIGELM
ncbi:hypothetical protein [Proteus mirabilis]|uniref:tail fiber/spike domain-containing protein n=1 Tax=Proteus mirabilis TaxID=584 RepID=UPI0034D6A99D